MKLVFEKGEITDKEIMILLDTDCSRLGLISLDDLLSYYKDNKLTVIDMLETIVDILFNSKNSVVRVGNYSKHTHSIVRNVRDTIYNLDDVLDDDMRVAGDAIDILYSLRIGSSPSSNGFDYYINVLEKLHKLDSRGRLRDLINEYIIHNNGSINDNRVDVLVIQYVFNIKYSDGIEVIPFQGEYLNRFQFIPPIYLLHKILMVEDLNNLNSLRTNILKSLLISYMDMIQYRNLHDLRSIKSLFLNRRDTLLSTCMNINESIYNNKELHKLIELTEVEDRYFNLFRNKLLKLSLTMNL